MTTPVPVTHDWYCSGDEMSVLDFCQSIEPALLPRLPFMLASWVVEGAIRKLTVFDEWLLTR